MRLVSRRTGLSPPVLRVWERRYGAVRPFRSAGGQRLYTDADIERLRLLQQATQAGRNIGQLVELSNETLEKLVNEDRRAQPAPGDLGVPERARAAAEAEAEMLVAVARQAVPRLDAAGLEAVLRRAIFGLGVAAALDHVVVPLLKSIGDGWARREITPAHEHLASAVVRRVLDSILKDCAPEPSAPTFVVATPTGQVHELGALLAAASAAAEGWRVVYLGSDLPVQDIAQAARETRARAVGLSIVYTESGTGPEEDVARLADVLPAGCRILVGGAAAESGLDDHSAARVEIVNDLPALRSRLAVLQRAASASS